MSLYHFICRIFGLIALCSFMPPALYAERTMAAGRVYDSFTRELLRDVQVDVLSKGDSALISTIFTGEPGFSFGMPCNIFIDSIPLEGAILYLRKEGYYSKFFNTPKVGRSEFGIELQPIMLDRIPFYRHKMLDEVSITVSKVKMVVRGDTITYNADAFALAQGSMLDGLIDQLPGVELKSDGKIYINGQFVNELLVNGDNFFKGDPRIALENLPAYMVNDIQVYHRNDMMEKIPLDELPLVMDVKLKKQFQTGWIANAEAGYGTSNRYLGRLFAMMFTRDSRLSLVGNINNTNDDRKPGQADNWNPNWQSAGRATIASAGIDYLWNSRLRNWKVEANLMVEHKKSDISSEGNSERYLSGGNLFGTQTYSHVSRQWRVFTDNKISFHIPRFWLYLKPTARFEREKAIKVSESSTANVYGSILNFMSESTDFYRRLCAAGVAIDGHWSLPASTNNLIFNIGLKWEDRQLENTTNRILLFPLQSEQSETMRPQEFMPERKLEVNGKVRYDIIKYKFSKINGNIKASYRYRHEYVRSTRDYFLTQIPDEVLPSVTEATQNAGFIPSNSFDYILNDDRHALKLSMTNWFPHLKGGRYQPNIRLSVNINYTPGYIIYSQAGHEYFAKRRNWYAEPEFRISVEDIGFLSYKYYTTLPMLRDLLDVADTANPLYVYLGNSGLKTTRTHEVWLNIYRLFKKGPGLEVTYNRYDNLVAQSALYDMTTGVTTYQPVNVNGNWDITGNLRYNRNLGVGERWRLESNTRVLYQNSVDMIGMDLSTVRNFNLGEKLKLAFKIMDGMELTATGNVEWRKATSPIAGFSPVSAVDFDYGIIFRAVKLPWDMSFTTDLTMHSRRGYSDARLNTNDLIWNARLAKSILHGNLTFAIDGFDILGNLSNVRLVMNSQGRTETRYNTLPRYAMLHVIYRLNIQPQKHR